jgi:predicted PurR-regulated permease PerM
MMAYERATECKEAKMSTEAVAKKRIEVNQPLESSIQIGLAALLVIGCLLIVNPFVPLLLWAIIIAIASYPPFLKLERVLKGRRGIAATVWTILLLAVLILPPVLLGQSLAHGIQPIVAGMRDGTLVLPPPPESVANWPLIGGPLSRTWAAASSNLSATLMKFAPQIKSAVPGLLAASAGFASTIVQLLISIVLSGVLLANAQAAYQVTRSLANRLFGEQGPEFQSLVGSTIRSVTNGVLGVALIQTVFAAAGFFVFGLPAAGVWSVVFLAAAVLQVGMLALIPAVIYAFAIASGTKAVIFLVWCIIVGLMDNVLKPLLLGRGAAVPIAVVFLGVIGGFIAMGLIGLFLGAIVLSVGYKLFLAWVEVGNVEPTKISDAPSAKAATSA